MSPFEIMVLLVSTSRTNGRVCACEVAVIE